MVELLIVAHAGLAREFCQAASFILGETALPINWVGAVCGEPREKIAQYLKDIIEEKHTTQLLIFTDVYGSTHANLCLPYLNPGQVEMICGFNLPMLLKAISLKDKMLLSELTEALVEYGRQHVMKVEGE